MGVCSDLHPCTLSTSSVAGNGYAIYMTSLYVITWHVTIETPCEINLMTGHIIVKYIPNIGEIRFTQLSDLCDLTLGLRSIYSIEEKKSHMLSAHLHNIQRDFVEVVMTMMNLQWSS